MSLSCNGANGPGSRAIPEEQERDQLAPLPHFDWTQLLDSTRALMHWSIGLGKPLLVGLPLLAFLLALLGYALVRVGWSCSIRRQWRKRRMARLSA